MNTNGHELDVVKLVAGDNPAAARFVVAWQRWCHLIDDLVDRDREVSPAERCAILTDFLVELAANPWFQDHRASLLGVMVQALNAWACSEERDKPHATLRERCERDVLKGYWHEVIYHVAWLTGGWERLRQVSALRQYDHESDTEAR